MPRPLQKPLLVYDGNCGFCSLWVARWRFLTASELLWATFEQERSRFRDLSPEELQSSVRLVEPDGRIYAGAAAVFRVLARAPGKGRWLSAYERLPLFAAASERAYRFITRHRLLFRRLTVLFFGDSPERETYDLVRWLFLRLLGIVYLIAFASLGVQVLGLIGKEGILPVSAVLEAVKARFGAQNAYVFPTLLWLDSSDLALKFLCWGGAGLSLALIAGLIPGLTLLALWGFYLSLTTAGQEFLSFQWDILLLETGFIAMFWAPGRLLWRKPRSGSPSTGALWLLRWLLFRLMFESGCVKLMSGDPTWRSLTALQYHYETQCIPTWLGWYAHQLPAWFQKVSAAGMFAVELGLPFLIFLLRRPRQVAFVGLSLLQVTIALTGNYCFFNLLTLLLCLTLLDDAAILSVMPMALRARLAAPSPPPPAPAWRAALLAPLIVAVLVISGAQLAVLLTGSRSLPAPVMRLMTWVSPFHPVNSYGLFAVMTVKRPEIVIEGTIDGRNWHAYEFKWKAGELSRRPPFVAPHQPRLDWQMWFAALGDYRNSPWFTSLLARLLMGSSEVHALLEKNPFPVEPPRYVRALLYEYHFTDFSARRDTGAWWRRNFLGLYCPVLTRKSDTPRRTP